MSNWGRNVPRRAGAPAQGPRARRYPRDSRQPGDLERVVPTSTDSRRPGVTTFAHIGFVVEDLDVRGVVERVREAGWQTVGEIVDNENTFLLCYVRGPEGLIVELAERLDAAPV